MIKFVHAELCLAIAAAVRYDLQLYEIDIRDICLQHDSYISLSTRFLGRADHYENEVTRYRARAIHLYHL